MRTSTIYVQVRDLAHFREVVAGQGKQVDIAKRAGVAPARLSQLVGGKIRAIPIDHAAALEDACAVARGALFQIPCRDLAADYVKAA